MWFGNRTKKENARLTNAALFYGAEALSFKLLELVNDQSLLTERERHWYWHYKAQEELGLCAVANVIEPSENPMRDPEVVARRSANPEWRMGQVERAKRARARVSQCFIAPDGAVYRNIPELSSFCREHGLNISKMSEVGAGKRPQHKGWIRYQEEEIYQ